MAAAWRDITAGITLASVVIGPGMRKSVLHLDVGVVVDIAVQGRHHVRMIGSTRALGLVAVQRMAVRLADDAHAGPTGVPEHRHARIRRGERQPQQLVAFDRRRGVHECCRRARRSRRPPCTRSSGRRRPTRTEPFWNSGSVVRCAIAATTAGSSATRPWRHTNRCRPAESRPRTSSRSMADSACCTAMYPAVAAWPASTPANAATARAVRMRSWRTAHSASRASISSAPAISISSARHPHAQLDTSFGLDHTSVETVEARGHCRDQVASTDHRVHAGHAVQQIDRTRAPARPSRRSTRPTRHDRAAPRGLSPTAPDGWTDD